MPVAACIDGASSRPARASTLEIVKELHWPYKIRSATCQLTILAARINVTSVEASAATLKNVAAKAVFASKRAASRVEKNTIICPHRHFSNGHGRSLCDAGKQSNTNASSALFLRFTHAPRIADAMSMSIIPSAARDGNKIPPPVWITSWMTWSKYLIPIDTLPAFCAARLSPRDARQFTLTLVMSKAADSAASFGSKEGAHSGARVS